MNAPRRTSAVVVHITIFFEIFDVSDRSEQIANAMIINILQESYFLFFDKMFVVLTVLQIYKKVAEINQAFHASCKTKKVQDHIVLNLKVSRISSLYARLSTIICTDISWSRTVSWVPPDAQVSAKWSKPSNPGRNWCASARSVLTLILVSHRSAHEICNSHMHVP